MSLDIKILEEAKKAFSIDYSPKIEELGYVLAHGTTHVNDSLAIAALVQNLESADFSEEMIKQVRGIIPEFYTYKGKEIPVKLEFRGPVYFQ